MPAFRINDIPLWLDEPESLLADKVAQKLGLPKEALRGVRIIKSVLDARKRGSPRYVHCVEVELEQRPSSLPSGVTEVELPPTPPHRVRAPPSRRPIVIGMGPAGLFCALDLAERGVRSLVLERGRDVVERRKDVARMMRDGSLDPESNMSFGEGGAGAYTDGKLSTRLNHPWVRRIIETFVRFGAPDRILVQGKPHIGSDLLPLVIQRMREALIALGVEVRFGSRVEDVSSSDGAVTGVRLADGTVMESDRVVLAVGNSARGLFRRFAGDGRVAVEAKPFAVGFRAEHPQTLIDAIQYGEQVASRSGLPAADYKLAENLREGRATRGVYSFCMCPGGLVVPTPTDADRLAINGMSNSHRNARYANAGVVAAVSPEDFAREGFTGPLAGLEFQERLELRAYEFGGGRFFAPAQSIPDFLAHRPARRLGGTSYRPGINPADLHQLFPEWLTAALVQGIRGFERRMRGFGSMEGKLIGIESRTSSPVRLPRNEKLQSVSMKGLYPVGEGCGYAGGIVSSAVDGLRVAEQICSELS